MVYPIYIVVIDYLLGIIMWTLIARSVIDFFASKNSEMVMVVVFRQVTTPFIRFFYKITPQFLAYPLVALYVAWWFYMVRFYVIPFIYFGEVGLLSFPLESAIVQTLFG